MSENAESPITEGGNELVALLKIVKKPYHFYYFDEFESEQNVDNVRLIKSG